LARGLLRNRPLPHLHPHEGDNAQADSRRLTLARHALGLRYSFSLPASSSASCLRRPRLRGKTFCLVRALSECSEPGPQHPRPGQGGRAAQGHQPAAPDCGALRPRGLTPRGRAPHPSGKRGKKASLASSPKFRFRSPAWRRCMGAWAGSTPAATPGDRTAVLVLHGVYGAWIPSPCLERGVHPPAEPVCRTPRVHVGLGTFNGVRLGISRAKEGHPVEAHGRRLLARRQRKRELGAAHPGAQSHAGLGRDARAASHAASKGRGMAQEGQGHRLRGGRVQPPFILADAMPISPKAIPSPLRSFRSAPPRCQASRCPRF
jgi:hypothetical protein